MKLILVWNIHFLKIEVYIIGYWSKGVSILLAFREKIINIVGKKIKIKINIIVMSKVENICFLKTKIL